MALITPRSTYRPLERMQIADRTRMSMYIGQIMNQRHMFNRQMALQHVRNPLSQMKVRDVDRAEFQNIQADITAKIDEVAKTGEYSTATGAVFGATEKLLQNQGLKAMQNSYAMEQAYNKRVDESEWDAATKRYLKFRSQLESSAIDFDAPTNTVLGGGFKGYDFKDKPYDENKAIETIGSVLSHLPADSREAQSVLTDPKSNLVKGISSITGENGETVVAMFRKVASSNKGVTYDKAFEAARNLLMNNRELIEQRQFIAERDLWMSRLQKDESNPNQYSLRDLSAGDLVPIYQGNEMPIVMRGLGLDLNSLVTRDEQGNFIANSITPENGLILDTIEQSTGIDLLQVITDNSYASKLSNEQQLALKEILNKGFETGVQNLYELTSGGLDFNQWATQKIVNAQVQGGLMQQLDSFGKTYSYRQVSSKEDLIANAAYGHAFKAYQEKKKDALNEAQSVMNGDITSQTVTLGTIASDNASINRISESIVKERNNLANIDITPVMTKAGISIEDMTDLGKIFKIVESVNTLSDEDKGKLLAYAQSASTIKSLEAYLANSENVTDKAIKLWKQNPDAYTGYGYYKVADYTAKIILDKGFKTFAEYNNWYYTEGIKDVTYKGFIDAQTKVPKALTEAKFNKIRDNAVHNILTTYNKQNPNNPITVVTSGILYANDTEAAIQGSQAVRNDIVYGNGAGWIIDDDPSGKLAGNSATTLAGLLSIDQRNPQKQGGYTVRGESKPINGKPYGIDGEIAYTEVLRGVKGRNVNGVPIEQAVILCKDAAGQIIGKVNISRDGDKEYVNRMAMASINSNVKAMAALPPEDPRRSIYLTSALRTGQSLALNNDSFLLNKNRVVDIPTLTSELAYMESIPDYIQDGKVSINTVLTVNSPSKAFDAIQLPIRISKTVGSDQYTCELLSTHGGRAIFENVQGSDPGFVLTVPSFTGDRQILVPEMAPNYLGDGYSPIPFASIEQGLGILNMRLASAMNDIVASENRAINRANGLQTK